MTKKEFIKGCIGRSPEVNPHTGMLHLVRTAGSYIPGQCLTNESAREFLSSLNWNERKRHQLEEGVYNPSGDCRYFQAIRPEGVDAIEGVSLLRDLPEGVTVMWRDGSHQQELVANMNATKTRTVSLITGPGGEDGDIVWTWYPGRFTPFVRVAPGTPRDKLPGNITVKLMW